MTAAFLSLRTMHAPQGGLLVLVVLAALALSGSPASAASAPPSPGARTSAAIHTPAELAYEARTLEDAGAYSRMRDVLRGLRRRVPLDGDLEIALALAEARSGAVDSAWSRLSGPVLSAAAFDTVPSRRWVEYSPEHEAAWIDGRFDGWHWYIWRARLEIAASQGRWLEALDAARQCVRARSYTGKEWMLLAVCAGRAGKAEDSKRAAALAATLDPTLPEAHYMEGWWDWKEGRRAEAQNHFRRAVSLDSTFRPAALALVLSRLPGVAPDTLPSELLTGVRRIGLLTSPEGPKLEEFVEMDAPATVEAAADPLAGDSLKPGTRPIKLRLSLLVDERGRVALNDLPVFSSRQVPITKVVSVLASLPQWRFAPAMRHGEPRRSWSTIDVEIQP